MNRPFSMLATIPSTEVQPVPRRPLACGGHANREPLVVAQNTQYVCPPTVFS